MRTSRAKSQDRSEMVRISSGTKDAQAERHPDARPNNTFELLVNMQKVLGNRMMQRMLSAITHNLAGGGERDYEGDLPEEEEGTQFYDYEPEEPAKLTDQRPIISPARDISALAITSDSELMQRSNGGGGPPRKRPRTGAGPPPPPPPLVVTVPQNIRAQSTPDGMADRIPPRVDTPVA